MEDVNDIDRFLRTIDQITDLVKDLNSSDVEVVQKTIQKADSYIASLEEEPCRTKVNKTKINTNPSPQFPYHQQSPESFMKMLEKDAEDRRRRRCANEKKALVLKEKGNQAFAQEDYEAAVKHYTKGLAKLKDMQQLYTNRAQAFYKLGKYTEAISDCDWALRCDDRCSKAYVHMGKSYLELKDYKESRSCFTKILEIEPKKEKMVREYLTRVDLEEERELQEVEARREFDQGEAKVTAVPKLLEKLSMSGHIVLYYCGGIQILSEAVQDSTAQTLFRLSNGFRIISDNSTVRSCLEEKTEDKDSRRLLVSVLKLWRAVCDGNSENQKVLLSCPVTTQALVDLLASEEAAVQTECLSLLHVFSRGPHGRRVVIEHLNVSTMVRNIITGVSKPWQQRDSTAVEVLENFAGEDKLCMQLRDVLTYCVTEPFTSVLRTITESSRPVFPSLISAIDRLAQDDIIHHKLAHDSEFWKTLLVALKQCSSRGFKEVLYSLLGLIINLSGGSSPAVQDRAVELCDCCLGLLKDSDGGVITQALGVLSTVLPQSSEAVKRVIQANVVPTLCRMLKRPGQNATKYAMKTLTVCTAASRSAREELLRFDKKLSILRRLLGSSCDVMVAGNAALCLGHCLELEGVSSRLVDTDVVLQLLRHAAGDAKETAVQQNAAIALGKLCRSEPRYLNRLRELHGFEILHSCVKLIT